MASAGNISVSLVLDGADQFKLKIDQIATNLDKMTGAMVRQTAASRRVHQSHDILNGSFRNMALNIELTRLSVLTLSNVLGFLPKIIMEQASYFDKTTLLLTGLNVGTMGYADATEEANKQLKNLMTTASSSPYRLDAMVDSFTKLKSANIDNAEGFLVGLVNTTAKFGKSSEELKRASIAIQQMAGKGVLSMEELRQQFGEAVPDAMGMMARAANISMGDLVKRVSTGTVEAKQALTLLAREMFLSSSGSAVEMSKTWEGAINRIVTSLQKLAIEAKTTGFYQNMVSMADQFNNFLNTDEAIADSRRLMLVLNELATTTANVATTIYAHAKAFSTAIATLMAMRWVGNGIESLAAKRSSFVAEMATWPASMKPIHQEMLWLQQDFRKRGLDLEAQYQRSRSAAQDKAILAAMDANKRQFDIDRSALQTRLTALQAGKSRLVAISSSVAGMFGGWINVIVAAIGVGLYALDEFYFKQKRIAKQMLETKGMVGSWEDLETTKAERNSDNTKLEKLYSKHAKTANELAEKRKEVESEIKKTLTANEMATLMTGDDKAYRNLLQSKGIDRSRHLGFVQKLEQYREEEALRAKLTQNLKEYDATLKVSDSRLLGEEYTRGKIMAPMMLSSGLKDASSKYETMIRDAEVKAKKQAEDAAKINKTTFDAEYNKIFPTLSAPARKQAEAEFEKVYESQARDVQSRMAAIREEVAKSGKSETQGQRAELQQLQGSLDKILEDRQLYVDTVKGKTENLEQFQKAAKQGGSTTSDTLATMKAYNAGEMETIKLQEQKLGLLGEEVIVGKYLAKLESEIRSNKYKGLSDEKIAGMRQEAMIRDKNAARKKTLAEMISERETAVDRLDDLGISVAKKMGTADAKTPNPFMDWEKSAFQTKEALNEIISKLKANGTDLTDSEKVKIAQVEQNQRMMNQYNIQAQLEKSITDAQDARLPTMERTRVEFDRQADYLQELLRAENARILAGREKKDLTAEEAALIESNIALIGRQKDLILEQKREQTTFFGIFQRNLREMGDSVTTQLEGAFEGVFDAFAAGIVDGKDSFRDMIDSMVKDLEKFFIKMAMMRAVESGVSALGGMFGGGKVSGPSAFDGFDFSTAGLGGKFASGGIMSSLGEIPLQKYAKGGIATSPQLALFGESSHNEAYVPLPDGRSIPVSMKGGGQNVQVNVINQSGVPMDAEKGNQRFDGEKYIIDVVVNAIGRPGRMRTAVQGAR